MNSLLHSFAWAFLIVWTVEVAHAADKSPNVLMICIDDLNDWTGFLEGHPAAQTPHMDLLARQGRVFTNAHCAVPVCTASRISVMSGLAATTHGSYELGPSYEELPKLAGVPTLQQSFHDNGYYTLTGGKVLHHGFRGNLASSIDRSLQVRAGGPRPKQPLNLPDGWSRAWDWGAFPEKDAGMFDTQLATKAAAALQEDFQRPFFMSVGFFRPHVPLHVPPKWFALYDEQSLSLPNNPLADLNDVPENFLTINQHVAAPTQSEVEETGSQRSLTHAYLASISYVDHCVGIVLDGLASSRYADNTIVLLWSDHGFHLGEKQHWAKRTLWEESTRVPLLVSGPGIKPGPACDEAVSLIDIFPTLVELCELPNNPRLEGVSLSPQLADPKTPREQPAITSSYFGNHSIRNRDWRLIVYRNGHEELYDHRSDPDEFDNLQGDPAYQAVRDKLARWLPRDATPEVKSLSELTPRVK
ncbi:sulfatase [Bremerella alba]|uniref:Arylsulfatase n=1 Tax=Bremerella alba TaxID=980252 RepID=A0A7V8V2R7_9BACT|nr:sulfatase [Bremerella alba]MBA2113574.1 Arylsulfatase [Bremerella alba]